MQSAWQTTRTMGTVFIALAIILLIYHIGIYWAVDAGRTMTEVLEFKHKRVLGSIGLVAYGIVAHAIAWLKLRKRSKPPAYKINRRGRRTE